MCVRQVISLLRDAFSAAGLGAYLRPYGCIPTGYERGVIEVVPHTKSRCAPHATHHAHCAQGACGRAAALRRMLLHSLDSLPALLGVHAIQPTFDTLHAAWHACGCSLNYPPPPLPSACFPFRRSAALGELSDSGLYDIFQVEFGSPGSAAFEAARRAFIASAAGYAVASFLLQAKDRHNGNLLVSNDGHLVHIDFGFILEISPGGNMVSRGQHALER